MTFRLPVNIPYVSWVDGQKVTKEDLFDEQNRNLRSDAAIVNNFLGSGLILETPNINVIFDSNNLSAEQSLYFTSNDFDGRGISPHNQPTDSILGNQLELILTDSDVSLRRNVKVCIIGTDFQDVLQYELFYFRTNESQVGKKHFKTIITILFNDFYGNKNGSKNLRGSIVIREASPMQLSKDCLSIAQNYEPNLFFRDFKVVDQTVGPNPTMVLYNTLLTALGTSGYSVDALNISIGYVDKKTLAANDIATRYGQKFLAKTNNIQKISLLLGIDHDYTKTDAADWFNWSGDIIISIHALQTSVSCPTDTIPNNAIDYQPNPSPIVQVILTQNILKNSGIILTDVAQPVDFIFTNTRVGSYVNTGIIAGNYYVVTVQRAGDTTVGSLFTLTGADYSTTYKFTQFNGTTWVDDSATDLWFEVYADSLKAASGLGYDEGVGISVNKTIIDSDTGLTIDYSNDGIPFANNGTGVLNYTVVQAVNELITPIQDSRTGNQIFSRQQSSAEISTISSTQLSSIEQTSNPIILGCAYDTNNRFSNILTFPQNYIGLANDNMFCIVNPPPELLLYNLVGSVFNPNIANPDASEYFIYKATLCVDGYGDLDGDGVISYNDIIKLNTLLGEDITTAATQQKILNKDFSAREFFRADIDGDNVITANDINLIVDIYNKNITTPLPHGDSFNVVCLYLENKYGRNDGYHSSYETYARLWDPSPRNVLYDTEPALEAGSVTLLYYGYPVPIDVGNNETALIAVPFAPVNFRITLSPDWMREQVKVNSTGRLMPCTFTDMEAAVKFECIDPVKTYCQAVENVKICNGGKNDVFIPDNLIIGNGQILSKNGKYFPIDFEVNTITLKLPALPIYDKSLDVFSLFVAESVAHTGYTTAGYAAMKFADCSFVQSNAMSLNQIRYSVSLESLSISVDGYDPTIGADAYGAIIDPLISTYIDHTTGVLTIRGTNLYADPGLTFNCKVLITVYIKKGGWNNKHTEVLPNELEYLLGL